MLDEPGHDFDAGCWVGLRKLFSVSMLLRTSSLVAALAVASHAETGSDDSKFREDQAVLWHGAEAMPLPAQSCQDHTTWNLFLQLPVVVPVAGGGWH